MFANKWKNQAKTKKRHLFRIMKMVHFYLEFNCNFAINKQKARNTVCKKKKSGICD